jgi:2-polyprenyl-3-methyl-5-hydroxy-6-metoxy-1,4-benzoquinol methylase
MKFIASIFPKEKGSILDIGCYHGLLGRFMTQRGYTYSGIDIDPELLKKTKSFGLEAKHCDLDREDIPYQGTYKYITFFDVLEHLHDPEAVLNKIKKKMNKESMLLISLPNDFHLLNRIRFMLGKPIYPDSFWSHTHLHTFTRNEAISFLKKQGFKILKTYELPGTAPTFLTFNQRRDLANISKGLMSRGTLYFLKLKSVPPI